MLELYNETKREARKQHGCILCAEQINKGEEYIMCSGKYDGEFFGYCLHPGCKSIVDAYCSYFGENEWNEDEIREWLSDGCISCPHGADGDDDCEESVFRCARIRDWMRRGDGDGR